jgi:hypothetical protein
MQIYVTTGENIMFKFKFGLTLFVLCEIASVALVHYAGTCYPMFGANFCDEHFLKYFLFLFAIPMVIGLIWLWIQAFIIRRRMRSFKCRAKKAMMALIPSFHGSRMGMKMGHIHTIIHISN